MSKINIISGFLGAGKTTLIKKLIEEAYNDEKIVLIENEFGEIGIDGTFLQESGVKINEMNSGCICCSLVGDFEESLNEVLTTYHPDRIIIEPSGVGKLSDVINAVKNVNNSELELDSYITVVDAKKSKMYFKNFGEFYNNQIENASLIVLSRSQDIDDKELDECLNLVYSINNQAPIITTPWDKINALDILNANNIDLTQELLNSMAQEQHHGCCGHHHEDHEHECCGHHHEEHDHECCRHHHEEHEHECCGHHHEDHDHECCGHHHHEGHHHADEVFTSIGFDTAKKYTKEELQNILEKLAHSNVLRAKGFVDSGNDEWYYFDLVPEEFEIRSGKPIHTGKVCVIGSDLDPNEIAELFLGNDNG